MEPSIRPIANYPARNVARTMLQTTTAVRRVIRVASAAILAACASPSDVLNSERIEARFGSYGVEILAQDASERRASLYSFTHDGRITRTYALVQFEVPLAAELRKHHEAVIDGASLGATYRAAGFSIRKITRHIGQMTLTDISHPLAQLMRLERPQRLAMHVYRLELVRGGTFWTYATIVEVHHPDYLGVDQLHAIYTKRRSNALDTHEIEAIVRRVLDRPQSTMRFR